RMCPRECGAERDRGQTGRCGVPLEFRIARAALHVWAAELLPLILILGSVVLYVVWESKSMYLMPYIVFMVPQASVGWIWAAHAVRTHDISTHMH
ncbi:MAG: hypothetical protein IJI12_03560, partial [Atopobiaceae bacterium]|nr:hypothetical protein [Atopobiaceae bacterium]